MLLVHDAYDDYVTCLANALAERCRVTLAHADATEAAMRPTLSDAVRSVTHRHRRVRDPRRALAVPRVASLARREGADLVHVQQSNDPWFNLAQLTGGAVPRVETVHDVDPHPGDATHVPGGHASLRVQRQRIDRFIVHSEVLAPLLAERWRVPASVIDVVPHGELGTLARRLRSGPPAAAVPGAAARVLFFGRIWPYKGLDRLVLAMNRLAADRPGLTLVIAGRGEPLQRYLAMADPALRLEVIDGFVPAGEVASLVESCTVACLPYLEASQSGVHALACGLGVPVVASAVGGLSTAVHDGDDGLLVPPGDVEALAAALARVLDDRALHARLSAGAVQRSRTDLDWGTIAEATIEVYDRALRTARR